MPKRDGGLPVLQVLKIFGYIGGTILAIYAAKRIVYTFMPPAEKTRVLLVDQDNIPIGWTPFKMATHLYNKMLGPNLFDASTAWESLANLNNDQIKWVHNIWQTHIANQGQTLYTWINEEGCFIAPRGPLLDKWFNCEPRKEKILTKLTEIGAIPKN